MFNWEVTIDHMLSEANLCANWLVHHAHDIEIEVMVLSELPFESGYIILSILTNELIRPDV